MSDPMATLLGRLEAQTLEIAKLKAEVRALEALRAEADARLAEAGNECTRPHTTEQHQFHTISAKLDYADLGADLDRTSVARHAQRLINSLTDQISVEDVTSRPFHSTDIRGGGWWFSIALLRPQPEFRIRDLGR